MPQVHRRKKKWSGWKQKGDEFRPQIEFHFVDSVAEERSLGKTVSAPNLVGLITNGWGYPFWCYKVKILK